MNNQFKPSIVFHPGVYIRDLMVEMEINQTEFSNRLGITGKTLSKLLNGQATLSKEIAGKLSAMTGTSIGVWLNLQSSYDEYCVKESLEANLEEDFDVLDNIDYNGFFAKHNILPSARKKEDKVKALRQYLNVASLQVFTGTDILLNCKNATYTDFTKKEIICVNTWMQTAINMGKDIPTDPYNEALFKKHLVTIRNMTCDEPNESIPKIKTMLSDSGIALVVLPHLKNSKINGAVKWLSPHKAVLAINTRGAYADIFWFALFHELQHVLQHKTKDTFLSYDSHEQTDINQILERDADDSARERIIPLQDYTAFIANKDYTDTSIIAFAQSINVHPGIVVGRLQHDKEIDYNEFNNLRVRYQISMH
ncbi:HigA family addiction module antitoxin [Eubacterium barkeri]|uniref:HTH-type transcriptional regulator / antitoxin HigA n=1 Tax=Eubacterium barkeri TaxID=1528 RepID=A0A1H3BGC0_EUBBA|nr:HigA family addiction module antitoxin [Eubacterium barkeri]SDX40835.1 HTH-type transcriptional regulator / antitoxin HigA [Eubacterium barkeri]